MTRRAVIGLVRGSVRFPEHPEHEGHWGLVGGEDVRATRSTFRSIGEAMTWADQVLAGEITPRTIASAGDLLEPCTEPVWSEGYVHVVVGRVSHEFISYGKGEWRRELPNGHLGEIVRSRT